MALGRAEERALSAALLETLLATTPVGIAFLDREQRYVRVNDALAAMSGIPVEEHEGRLVTEVHPRLAPKVLPYHRLVIEQGQPIVNVEMSAESGSGRRPPQYRRMSFYPVRGSSGEVIGSEVVVEDITGRRLAELEREQAQERLALLASASAVLAGSLDYEATLNNVVDLTMPTLADFGFFDVVEPDGNVRRIARAYNNPERQAVLAETRWARSDHDDMNLSGLSTGRSGFHPNVNELWMRQAAASPEHLALMRSLGFCSMITVPLLYQDECLGALTLFYAESGRHYTKHDLALAEELARRAAAAVENARLFKASQEAVRARDEFLSIASHELKTPISSLRGFAQLMLRRVERGQVLDEERVKRAFEVIDQQSEKLNRLVLQLLDRSRLEEGRLTLDRSEIDLMVLVDDVVRMTWRWSQSHPLVVRGPRQLIAEVDALRVEQVLTNLVDNAIRYSPPGKEIEIDVSTPSDTTVELSVRDHGIGIPETDREKVFERFYQGSSGASGRGMGLGLYISQQIVAQHGGSLRVEAPEDGGTRMVVSLSLRPTEEPT